MTLSELRVCVQTPSCDARNDGPAKYSAGACSLQKEPRTMRQDDGFYTLCRQLPCLNVSQLMPPGFRSLFAYRHTLSFFHNIRRTQCHTPVCPLPRLSWASLFARMELRRQDKGSHFHEDEWNRTHFIFEKTIFNFLPNEGVLISSGSPDEINFIWKSRAFATSLVLGLGPQMFTTRA